MDATCSVARRRRRSLSPIGTSAPAFRRDVTGGAGAVPGTRRPAGQCELVLRSQSNWQRAHVCLWSPAIHMGAPASTSSSVRRGDLKSHGRRGDVTSASKARRPRKARLTGGRKPSFFLRSSLAVRRPSGVTEPLSKPLDLRETRTALQHSAGRRRGAGRAGAHSCRAHAGCSATSRTSSSCSPSPSFRRATTPRLLGGVLPGGFGAEIWTFVTYSLIHADWTHFGVNAVWLLPFGSAVARRFGALRFLAFFAVTAAAGAAMHLVTHAGEQFPMIGASAAISGTMAAAMRFAFQRGGPLSFWRDGDDAAYRVPAIPLTGVSERSARAHLPGGLVRHQYSVRAGLVADHRQRPGGRLAGAYRRLSRRPVVVFLVRSGARLLRNSTIIGATRH